VRVRAAQFLPIVRWGGEPSEGRGRGNWLGAFYPSTMLRMVPLPASSARMEELR